MHTSLPARPPTRRSAHRPLFQCSSLRRSISAATVLTVALLTAGCGGDADAGQTGSNGFVSGEGIVTVLEPAEREEVGEVSGETLEGEPLSLAEYGAGKTVVVNVWGSWCAPCRAEADDLVAAEKQLRGRDVVFLGIDVRDPSPQAAQAFAREFKVGYPSLYDPSGRLLLAFHGTLPSNSVPTTLVIDDEGRAAASIVGETTTSTLIGVVEEAQGVSPAAALGGRSR
jgi:thiol-disulfide isomerase/thioredoxin